MIDHYTHLLILAQGRRLRPVKRLSPFVIIAAIAAVAVALIRGSEEPPPAESWIPVDPS